MPSELTLRRTLERMGYVSATIHLSIGEVACLYITMQSALNGLNAYCAESEEKARLEKFLQRDSVRLVTAALCGSAHKAHADNGFAIADEETFLIFRMKMSAFNAFFLVETLIGNLKYREDVILGCEWLPNFWAKDLPLIYSCSQATAAKIMSSCGFTEIDCLRQEWDSLSKAGLNALKLDRLLAVEGTRGR